MEEHIPSYYLSQGMNKRAISQRNDSQQVIVSWNKVLKQQEKYAANKDLPSKCTICFPAEKVKDKSQKPKPDTKSKGKKRPNNDDDAVPEVVPGECKKNINFL